MGRKVYCCHSRVSLSGNNLQINDKKKMPKVIYIQYNLCKNKDFIYRKILYLVNLKAGQDGEPQALEKKQ